MNKCLRLFSFLAPRRHRAVSEVTAGSGGQRQTFQLERIVRHNLYSTVSQHNGIGMAKTAQFPNIQDRFYRKDHTRLDYGRVAAVEERAFVVAHPDGMTA